MKALIVTVTTGGGHNSAARALADEFDARGVDNVVVDFYKYISRVLYKIMDKGYIFSTKHLPKQFGKAYTGLENHEVQRKIVTILSRNKSMAKKFAGYFEKYTPDVIITTHVFAAQVLNELKKYGFLRMPVIGIITDFCVHPFWEELQRLEYIVTADKVIEFEARRKGISENRLLPYGIPVDKKFDGRKLQKPEARKKLGLDPDKKTVLFMAGSMGFGNMIPNVAKVDSLGMGLQIVCICGNNKELRKKLSLLATKEKITVLGYVNNVEEYMDAADCIVTKPGGLTVSEALAKRLPIIILNPIPGPELRNSEFLLNSGAAIKVSDTFPITSAISYLFSDEKRLELMEQSVNLIAHPDAAIKLADFVQQLDKERKEKAMV